MNISGYQDNNFHDGNTQVLGDLIVDGKLTIGGATGQSEYLDSGDYKGTILGVPSHWVSMGLSPGTQYRYEKNGNIINVHLQLRGVIKANIQYPQISITVPSTDLFNIGHVGTAYVYSTFILPTGLQFYTAINNNISTSGGGVTTILIFYESNSTTNNQETTDIFVHLAYKLNAPDVPATLLVSGGSGQGNVQNPMLESLDAGGYDIKNIGTLSATLINASNVVSNPLIVDLSLGGYNITNANNIETSSINTNEISTIAPATQLKINNEINFTNKNLLNINDVQTNNTLTNAIYPRTPAQPIQIYEDTVYNEKSIFQLAGIINAGLELTINTATVNFANSNISEPGIIQKTGTLTFNSASSYDFLNYVDFTTKRLNTIRFIRSQADFQTLTTLSGLYVIVGSVNITSQLTVTGSIHITGYDSLSSLDFNIPTGGFNNYCLRNNDNSGDVYISNIRITNQSLSYETMRFTNTNQTDILKYDNVTFENNKNNRISRIEGFNLCNIIEVIARYNYGGGGSGIMFEFATVNNVLFTSNQILNNYQLGNTSNYFLGILIFISGASRDMTVTNNLISTYGLNSLEGLNISSVGTPINRVVIANNVFDYQGGALITNLVFFDTSIHKGIICADNTNIDTCRAYLEGISNANTVYSPTTVGTWTPIDLGPSFTITEINRFVPSLTPYAFNYDASNPIRARISINCQADHGTGGIDTVRLGLSKNGTVSVYVEGEISASQVTQLSLTTSLKLVFGDTLQLVCQNVTAGTNAQGFRAVSLNASLDQVT